MGKFGQCGRKALKLGYLINSMPSTEGKAYQQCTSEQKCRMMLELAFKEMTGTTYTQAWYDSNKKYL